MKQTGSAWVQGPKRRDLSLVPDVRVLRRRAWLIVAAIAVTVGAAVLISTWLGPSYTAQAQLIVTPVSRDDDAFTGLSVIRDSSDATRDVTTLTAYAETQDVRDEAARILAEQGFAPDQIASALGSVSIEPVASSSLVSIISSADQPETAAAVANAHADATVAVRQATFNAQVGPKLERAQAALAALPEDAASAPVREDLVAQISRLQSLSGASDPSFQILSAAVPPTGASSPGPLVIVPAAVVAGLVLGLAIAALYDALRARRVEDDNELVNDFGMPVLARVPTIRNPGAGVVPPHLLRAGAAEAYQALADGVRTLRRNQSVTRLIAFVSTEAGVGTSTSAFNTAMKLAASGHRVLLVDTDLRRHSLSDAIPVTVAHGTRSVLERRVSLRSAVVSSPEEPALDLLLVNPVEGFGAGAMNPDNVHRMIAQVGQRWHFVVFDTAGTGRASDLSTLASAVDDVVVAVRRGRTALDDLDNLMERFARHDIDVRGFVVIGGRHGSTTTTHASPPGAVTPPAPGPARPGAALRPADAYETTTVSAGEDR
jgi:Mrp family chromosome partitioning ATPase/capsular polysaccharide biosynthesis protein